ncbi:hypothetical protein HGK72_27105 [Mycolicibacterium fortuitum]|uniref:hypothetical protein n=1 Tax=Mycolicibacterium fortuitum TaxID=1766 RepID=UPI00148FF3B2|nr:hypothetical protein [Mycolicibacterium fortuitum]
MERSTERVFDARDVEGIKLLKTNPDAFFERKRKEPFGFVVAKEKKAKRTSK